MELHMDGIHWGTLGNYACQRIRKARLDVASRAVVQLLILQDGHLFKASKVKMKWEEEEFMERNVCET